MGSSSRPHHRSTYAQYAAVERESSTKHELFDGEIYAMAGGTEDHAAPSPRCWPASASGRAG